MKKLLLSFAVAGIFAFATAQTTTTTTKQSTNKPVLKEHVCTAACKNGKHVYAHGEKGHVCTAACTKKTM